MAISQFSGPLSQRDPGIPRRSLDGGLKWSVQIGTGAYLKRAMPLTLEEEEEAQERPRQLCGTAGPHVSLVGDGQAAGLCP